MTMPLLRVPLAVRLADLGDARERGRIEGFIRAHPRGTPFHLPQWSDAVAKACGQRAYTLLAERADGGLVAVLPLMAVSSPLFGKALVSNGFATGGGILGESEDTVAALADSAWALATKLGCPTCELRGGPLPENQKIRRRCCDVGSARWAFIAQCAQPGCFLSGLESLMEHRQ